MVTRESDVVVSIDAGSKEEAEALLDQCGYDEIVDEGNPETTEFHWDGSEITEEISK
jgi:hypothetical protein